MKPISRFFIAGLILCLIPWAVPCHGEDGGFLAQIARANDVYQKKQYQEAADMYENLAARGFENGYLYYNLGNAYFRLGQYGSAVLNYSRAKKLVPRFESVEANLRHAILKTPDQLMETIPPFLNNVMFWLDDFNLLEYTRAMIAANFLFWLAMAAWLFFRTPAMNLTRNFLFALLILTAVSAGGKFYTESTHKTGVVMEKRIDVKSERGPDHVTLFELHEGAIINIGDEEEEWYKIELKDGKKGWAPKKFIAQVF